MPFSRNIELGRVVLVNYGKDPLYGKLLVVVDVIDHARCVVDAPGIVRTQINFKRVSVTDIVVPVKRLPGKTALKAAWDEADVEGTWAASSWGKKIASQKKRAALTDFQRYQLKVARATRSSIIKKKL